MFIKYSGNVISLVLSREFEAVRARTQTIRPLDPRWKQAKQDVRVQSHHCSQQPALDVTYECLNALDVGRQKVQGLHLFVKFF